MSTFPIGLLRDLPPKRVMRAQAAGQDLVVWRASNGDIAAWDNRCPHRGMALSHGFVRGDALACLYHGWHYASSGKCSLILAHPDLEPPGTIQTRAFGVAERDGVLWVSIDGPAEPPALSMPVRPVRSFIAAAGAQTYRDACLRTAFAEETPHHGADGIWLLGDVRIVLLENPIGDARTQITVLAQADASPDQCKAVSRWCEAVARTAERHTRVAA